MPTQRHLNHPILNNKMKVVKIFILHAMMVEITCKVVFELNFEIFQIEQKYRICVAY